MALNAKSGSFTFANTGNKVITGVGFQPKVVLLMGTNQTTEAFTANAKYGIGAFTGGSTTGRILSFDSGDGLAASQCARFWSDTHCLAITLQQNNGTDVLINPVSMDSDG